MKTLADVKRRVVVGAKLLCVENTKRPELNGTLREVTQVQGNAFVWRTDPADARGAWTYWPKAATVTVLDADTFRMGLADAWGKPVDGVSVTLRFVT